MTFEDILDQAIAMLQRRGRLTYRTLKRQFQLDDEALVDLTEELIKGQRLAADENGDVLVWLGEAGATPEPVLPLPQPTNPADILSQVETSSPVAPRPLDAERRQLTVMFCDLVDSTALASQLDPEDLREVIRAYQATCAEVIQRFDGYIAQYLGDGLLVYFGYPQAHEDDAQRAVRVGLGIVEVMGALNAHLAQNYKVRLAVRLGIHTGLVVVGEMGSGGRQEQLALGDTPNIAARLQGLAAPDTVVISAATQGLIHGYFVCQALDTPTLKGVSQPLAVYHVLQDSGAQSRLDAAAPRGLTPLVGRDAEVALLRERWAQARDGLGQVVLLSGEAGIGKSRLVQVVKDHVAAEPHTRWECRCSPYVQHSALYPVIDLFQRILRFQEDDTAATKLGKLEEALAPYDVSLQEMVPLFAALLSVPVGDRYAPLTLPPERQRQHTLEAVLALLLVLAAQRPVLLIVEDLHWGDPSTLEWLSLVLDQVPTARLLAVLVFRPEFSPPWPPHAHLTSLTLSRLSRPQVEVMLERVTGDKTLPAEVCQQIVARTDGVPLFVEELTKMVLESGLLQTREDHYELMGPLPPLAIPTTLHDSLMARLDRLAAVREVAQLGATLGREFAYALLRAISPLDEVTLQRGLRQLVDAELIYQRGLPPQSRYLFKHALVQEAAYQSLLKSTRQRYHQRIAQVLEAQFPETVATQPELLAHHYSEAGLNAPAVGYWQRAGQRAMERSAHVEAVSHLTRGIEVLAALPDTAERTQQELTLQLALGPALIATRGYAAPDVEQTYARARELCQQVGDTPQLFPVLRGLHRFYLVRGQFHSAHAFGEQCFRLARQTQDADFLLDAQFALGESLFYLGELAAAQAYLTQGFALYTTAPQSSPVFRVVQDLGVSYLVHVAWILWLCGWPHQALQRCAQALTLARDLAHPFSQAYALNFMTMFQQLRRDVPATHEHAVATATLSATQGFPVFERLGGLMQGWARAAQGDAAEGLGQLLQGWAAYQATGAALFRSYFLSLLADTYGRLQQPEAGLRVLAEALAAEQTSGEHFYTAELHRLRGELLLQVGTRELGADDALVPSETHEQQGGEAEDCFRQALDLARQQQARALELRAATSLSRLWQQQGRRDEARELLAPIYGWFTEGFDTANLQEARVLLEELGENPS